MRGRSSRQNLEGWFTPEDDPSAAAPEANAPTAELVARTGRTALPVIVVGDEVVSGFDRGRLQRLLGI